VPAATTGAAGPRVDVVAVPGQRIAVALPVVLHVVGIPPLVRRRRRATVLRDHFLFGSRGELVRFTFGVGRHGWHLYPDASSSNHGGTGARAHPAVK